MVLPPATIRRGEESFDLSFPLPDAVVGKMEMNVALEVSRTFHAAPDPRDFSLHFGVFEVR
jgi:hypothetical protein